MDKKFAIKIYDPTGADLIKTYTHETVKNPITFTERMNAGQGECVLDLELPFDDFGEGSIVDFMNVVRIQAIIVDDALEQTQPVIYTGFMSKYEPYLDESGGEGVRVTLLGVWSLASFIYYKDADYTVPHTAADPTDIIKAIVDYFQSTSYGTLLTYAGGHMDDTGESVDITFEDKKCADAIMEAAKLVPPGWWWKNDETGEMWLQDKPATPTHTFTIGKDIESLKAPKNSEKVINDVLVRWDGGTSTDSDGTSQTSYGKRETIISDTQLKDANAGSNRAVKEVDDNKDNKINIEIAVNDKYENGIESIKPGHTCRIKHYKNESTFFGDNMQIIQVQYSPTGVKLTLEEHGADFGVELAGLVE